MLLQVNPCEFQIRRNADIPNSVLDSIRFRFHLKRQGVCFLENPDTFRCYNCIGHDTTDTQDDFGFKNVIEIGYRRALNVAQPRVKIRNDL